METEGPYLSLGSFLALKIIPRGLPLGPLANTTDRITSQGLLRENSQVMGCSPLGDQVGTLSFILH